MDKIYLLADTHFEHSKCPRSQEEIDSLFKQLESLSKTDILIHLGDVSLHNDTLWHLRLTTLQCRAVLIKGNHDSKGLFWYIKHGWSMVCNSLTINKYGYDIIFTHEAKKHLKVNQINICGHMHYPELHITNKISLPAFKLFELESLIKQVNKETKGEKPS